MRTVAVLLLGLILASASLSVDDPRGNELRIVAASGSVAALNSDRALTAGIRLSASDVLRLGSGAALRLATGCGQLADLAGPGEGPVGRLLGAALPDRAARGCQAGADPRSEQRRRLILSFVEEAPTRILRGGGAMGQGSLWQIALERLEPGCYPSAGVPRLVGDRSAFGDSIELEDLATGERALAFRENDGPAFTWPAEISARDMGRYSIATPLGHSGLDLRAVTTSSTDDPEALALRLVQAGCLTQAKSLLTQMPSDNR